MLRDPLISKYEIGRYCRSSTFITQDGNRERFLLNIRCVLLIHDRATGKQNIENDPKTKYDDQMQIFG